MIACLARHEGAVTETGMTHAVFYSSVSFARSHAAGRLP